jgi:hypothetical protein
MDKSKEAEQMKVDS